MYISKEKEVNVNNLIITQSSAIEVKEIVDSDEYTLKDLKTKNSGPKFNKTDIIIFETRFSFDEIRSRETSLVPVTIKIDKIMKSFNIIAEQEVQTGFLGLIFIQKEATNSELNEVIFEYLKPTFSGEIVELTEKWIEESNQIKNSEDYKVLYEEFLNSTAKTEEITNSKTEDSEKKPKQVPEVKKEFDKTKLLLKSDILLTWLSGPKCTEFSNIEASEFIQADELESAKNLIPTQGLYHLRYLNKLRGSCPNCLRGNTPKCPILPSLDKKVMIISERTEEMLNSNIIELSVLVRPEKTSSLFTQYRFSNYVKPRMIEKPSIKIEDCLVNLQKLEDMDEDCLVDCETCQKKTRRSMQSQVDKLPQTLFIQLKRFKTYFINGEIVKKKNNLNVKYETELVLNNQNYKLVSIVNHVGELSKGHYTALGRDPYSDKWLFFDDEEVTPVKSEKISNPHAYLLFYEKENDNKMKLKSKAPEPANPNSQKEPLQLKGKIKTNQQDRKTTREKIQINEEPIIEDEEIVGSNQDQNQ